MKRMIFAATIAMIAIIAAHSDKGIHLLSPTPATAQVVVSEPGMLAASQIR